MAPLLGLLFVALALLGVLWLGAVNHMVSFSKGSLLFAAIVVGGIAIGKLFQFIFLELD